MQRRPVYRLNPKQLACDRVAIRTLCSLAEYGSANPQVSSESLGALEAQVAAARLEEERLARESAAARDAAVTAEWALHDAVLTAKHQAIVLFGPDAAVVEALGLKKKSAYRRPGRRARPAEE